MFAKRPPRIRGTWCRRPLDAARFMRACEGWDVYIQLNPCSTPGLVRPAARDCAVLQALLVDADPTGETTAAWDWTPVGDAVAIDSGRGRQFWLRFDPPAPPEKVGHAEAFLRNLRAPEGVRIDATYDLPRLARMPGTVNSRTGRQARILSVGPPLAPAWLERFKPVPREVPRAWAGRLADVMPVLTRRAADFLLFGADEGERHAACYAAARSLYEAGAAEEVALAALLRGAERCGLPEWDTVKVWRRIYGLRRETR